MAWTTALDLDLSALPNQSLSANQAYTVGGYTFNRFNAASDATAMAIVNGQGLVIRPIAATDYNGATRSIPGVSIPILQLIPSFQLGMSLRLSVYNSSLNAAANYDCAVFGFDNGSAQFGYLSKRGVLPGGQGLAMFFQANSVNVSGFIKKTMAVDASNNVCQVETPYPGMGQLLDRYGSYSAGFPSQSNMNAAFGYSANGNLNNGGVTPANLAILLGAQRSNSATALVCTFARIKLEYR